VAGAIFDARTYTRIPPQLLINGGSSIDFTRLGALQPLELKVKVLHILATSIQVRKNIPALPRRLSLRTDDLDGLRPVSWSVLPDIARALAPAGRRQANIIGRGKNVKTRTGITSHDLYNQNADNMNDPA
jgi:hypothetical protein